MTDLDLNRLTIEQLRARRTLKWNTFPADVLAMWVAEMDYPTAAPITAALRRAVAAEGFGYPLPAAQTGLPEVLAQWQERRHGWSIDPAGVHLVADVMKGVALAIETFSGPDDPVVVSTPVYMPFFDVIELTGRPQVHVPIRLRGGCWTMDLDRIDAALSDGARTVLLCNPHNPLGRVFGREELTALADLVMAREARVIADEVHAPLVFEASHIPYASLSPVTAAHTVTVTSASKAWNLPGLKCAQVITSNASDTERWQHIPLWATVGVSTLGIEASIAAYQEGGDWLAQVLALLERHRTLVADATSGMPGARHVPNEGTYLAWLDFTELDLPIEPAQWFLERARVAMSAGPPFRAPERRFARLNFGTTTAILREALERMAEAVDARRGKMGA